MKTVTLHISDGPRPVDGSKPDCLVTLRDDATKQVFAQADLRRDEIDQADWHPDRIRTRFREGGDLAYELEEIGDQLGQWLYRDGSGQAGARGAERTDVGECLDEVMREDSIRVLLDVTATNLDDLPWELLRHNGDWDFQRETHLFARLHTVDRDPPEVEWPLRVLVVVGAAIDDDIAAEEEVEAIERILHPFGHSVDREVMLRPTRDEFREKLPIFRPHVFIFIGHCEFDPNTKKVVLRMSPGEPNNWNWRTDQVGSFLGQADWLPTLVILNACKTWQRSASVAFSEAFARAGVPALIMMQADVRGDLAGLFSAQVLRYLVAGKPREEGELPEEGQPLDYAVASARVDLSSALSNPGDTDWSYPVLSLARSPEELIPKRPLCTCCEELKVTKIFHDGHFITDRRDLRRRIRSNLLKVPSIGDARALGERGRLLVVVGDPKSGKSLLVKWCLEHFAFMFEAHISYVSLSSNEKTDFVELLRRIRDGAGSKLRDRGSAFDAFNWQLNNILAGHERADWDGSPATDKKIAFDATALKYEQAVDDIFRSFRDALVRLGEQRKTVIALDQFRDAEVDYPVDSMMFREMFVPYLLRPIRDGQVPGVLMTVVIERKDCCHFGIDTLLPASEWISIDSDFPYSPEALTRELYWYPNSKKLETLHQLSEMLAETMHLSGQDKTPMGFVLTLRNVMQSWFGGESSLRAEYNIGQMR